MRTMLAAAAALCLMTGVAQARPIPEAGLTLEEILAYVKGAGFEAKIETSDDGDRYVTTQKDGVNFDIDVYDCDKNRRCRAVQFVASFDMAKGLGAAKANEWNRSKRYVRVYLNNENDPIFAYDANLAPGGTYEALQDDLDVFLQFLPEILEHIDW